MQIKTFKPEDHKIKALIYGAAGAGKTVFAGSAEKVLFASAEGGLLSIAERNPEYVSIKSLRDLNEVYTFLEEGNHNYETVVLDSISEMNEIIKMEIEKRLGRPMQLQDWGELSAKISTLFRKFRDLPMNVILIAQESFINDDQKIKKIVPELNGKAATAIARHMDVVGYLHVEADGQRWIQTTSDKHLLTKDRTKKIGDDCPLDFTEWQKRVSKIKTGKQEVKEEYSAPTPQPKSAVVENKPSTTNHVFTLKKELMARGAKDLQSALKLLNESLGTECVDFNFSEETAAKMLIQLLQKPTTIANNATVVEHPEESFPEFTDADKKKVPEVSKDQTAICTDYSDPVKVEKLLKGLSTIRECSGLDQEIKESYDKGDMTESVYRANKSLVSTRIGEISENINMPKRTRKVKKTAA